MGKAIHATWDQDSYRFYANDAAPNSATPNGATNGTPSDIAFDTPFLVRFLVQETAGTNQLPQPIFYLQFNVNGGTYNSMALSTYGVRMAASSHFADGDSIAALLSAGTYKSGQAYETDYIGNALGASNGSDEYEVAWCVEFNSAATSLIVAVGDTIGFRLLIQDGDLNVTGGGIPFITNGGTYTNSPTITVASAAKSLLFRPNPLQHLLVR